MPTAKPSRTTTAAMSNPPQKSRKPNPKTASKPRAKPLTARTADRHTLYQIAVQGPAAEVAFVASNFKRLRARPARTLREDFCGTALTACEWVKAHKDNTALGLDLHKPTLAWGREHNVATLPPAAQERIRLLPRNVLTPGPDAGDMDVILAMNFSYWIFKTRPLMLTYFKSVLASLARDGVFFLDIYGGFETAKIQEDRRRCPGGFTYIWDQASYNPITADYVCKIHFEFKRGPAMQNAFTYEWRLWTLAEIRELLTEAGFRRVSVYWEGDNGKGGGNGIFRPRAVGDPDAAYICYLSAEK